MEKVTPIHWSKLEPGWYLTSSKMFPSIVFVRQLDGAQWRAWGVGVGKERDPGIWETFEGFRPLANDPWIHNWNWFIISREKAFCLIQVGGHPLPIDRIDK